jgi:hypothetical protein
MPEEDKTIPLSNVITIDDERIRGHLDRVVRGTVEETLNAPLDAEADRLCNAQRYERTEARRDTRAGHYERGLQTKAGEVTLRVPKLRRQTFETAIIERYRRREGVAVAVLEEGLFARIRSQDLIALRVRARFGLCDGAGTNVLSLRHGFVEARERRLLGASEANSAVTLSVGARPVA